MNIEYSIVTLTISFRVLLSNTSGTTRTTPVEVDPQIGIRDVS
jgi:hypothetical protein